jgi:hypothetical protein
MIYQEQKAKAVFGMATKPIIFRDRFNLRRGPVAVTFVTALALAGCTDPYTGRVDLLRTGLLGAGAGALAFGTFGAIEDSTRGYGRHYGGYGYRPYGGYGRRSYSNSYGYGYPGGYLPPIASPYGYSGGYGAYGYGHGFTPW